MSAFAQYEPLRFDFTDESTITCIHNLNRSVSVEVWIGEEQIICEVNKINDDTIVVFLTEVATGYILVG